MSVNAINKFECIIDVYEIELNAKNIKTLKSIPEQIFKVGDIVFDSINFPGIKGKVKEQVLANKIVVEFNTRMISYTLQGKLDLLNKTSSATRSLYHKPYINDIISLPNEGEYCFMWNDEKEKKYVQFKSYHRSYDTFISMDDHSFKHCEKIITLDTLKIR